MIDPRTVGSDSIAPGSHRRRVFPIDRCVSRMMFGLVLAFRRLLLDHLVDEMSRSARIA